jgi:sarcosine oxidase subunit beta
MAAAEVIVVGGGLHGCCTALHLRRGGAQVSVVEKAYPGRHASGVNAGGVRTLGRHFAEVPLALRALDIWGGLEAEIGDGGGFVRSGQVRVAENEAGLARLAARVADLERLGYTHERLIDRAELRRRLPSLADHCVGGTLAERDGFAEPFRTATAFRRAAERAGVRFLLGREATEFARAGPRWQVRAGPERLEADILVNAAGAWGKAICAVAGDTVDLVADALTMTVTQRMPAFVAPVVGCEGSKLSLKQAGNGNVVIGGGYYGKVHPDRGGLVDFSVLPSNLGTAVRLFPILRDAQVLRCWAGIEGRTPDQIPVIGWSPSAENLFHVFGFSAHGFELSPIVGKLVAASILTGRREPLFDPFNIRRFAAEKTEILDSASHEE